jgi:hypothetical protein
VLNLRTLSVLDVVLLAKLAEESSRHRVNSWTMTPRWKKGSL